MLYSQQQQQQSMGNPASSLFTAYPPTDNMGMNHHYNRGTTVPMPPSTPPGPPTGVRVVVRVRPRNEMESMRDEEDPAIECHEDCRTILVKYGDAGLKGITFNKVCSPRAQQEDVFEECRVTEMIMQALDGYSATIFAFGQTGSGKTFTITGPDTSTTRECDPSRFGIIPRALQHLYQVLDQKQQESPNIECKVSAAYLEIYNEQVQDLLNPNGASLPIRWNAARGFYVENLLIVECETYEDCLAVLEEGLRNRKTGSHSLNEHSSRSHSIMTIYVTTKEIDPDDGKPMVKHGRISFVDLAGSERVKSSKASGDTLNETLNINKSLLTLGNCISCLADTRRREGHIPYRDSKLTMLLSDSLGGHGIALMIACISPSTLNFHETIKTLRYAQRAKKIRNKPIVLVDPVLDVVVQLKREVKGLRRENAALRARVESRQQGDGLRLPAIAGITPQTSMQQMYMQPSYANTPQPQQQQQQLHMQQRYTPQIYTPRPPSQPPPSHLQHLQHNPQTLTPHPPSQPHPSHIPRPPSSQPPTHLPRLRRPISVASSSCSSTSRTTCSTCTPPQPSKTYTSNRTQTLRRNPLPKQDPRKSEYHISSRKTNRQRIPMMSKTPKPPPPRHLPPLAPLPHDPTIEDVERFVHHSDAPHTTQYADRLLPLSSLSEVTAVKGWILRDVEALDREIRSINRTH